VDILIEHISDPLGAGLTLSMLLTENEKLMLRYAKPKLVKRFMVMIRDFGPQEYMINFFEVVVSQALS
jgi:hypothetical protein